MNTNTVLNRGPRGRGREEGSSARDHIDSVNDAPNIYVTNVHVIIPEAVGLALTLFIVADCCTTGVVATVWDKIKSTNYTARFLSIRDREPQGLQTEKDLEGSGQNEVITFSSLYQTEVLAAQL